MGTKAPGYGMHVLMSAGIEIQIDPRLAKAAHRHGSGVGDPPGGDKTSCCQAIKFVTMAMKNTDKQTY